MTTFEIAALILTLAASFGFVNARFLKLPSTVGLMAVSFVGSLGVIALDQLGVIDASRVHAVIGQADLGHTLLHGMLGFLLFAGALHVDLTELAEQRWPIAALALGGTVISTALVAIASYVLLALIGLPLSFEYCLVFGALISPTDPIAVLGILKSTKAPRDLEIQIGGESLFNDGVGVVIFTVVLVIAEGGTLSPLEITELFLREAVGGAVFGIAVGWIAFRFLKSIDAYVVEVMITLAVVVGGYAVAERLEISAPIAMVCAGLLVGNQGRKSAMSDVTRHHVDQFWTLVDEILNAVLFCMLGLEAARLPLSGHFLLGALAMIPVVLAVRFVAVGIPITVLRSLRRFTTPHAVKLLTWGGLRGGLSLAMALSLPESSVRSVLLILTYAVVASSILVQGLTLQPLIRRLEVCP